jgi:hypothetical protein
MEIQACQGIDEIRADLLDEDLLKLGPGERLWRLYCIRPQSGQATDLRHRIYTKHKADGRLALVTFAAHNPGGKTVRSGIARVPDLSIESLDRIIEAIRQQTPSSGDDCETLDLGHLPTVEEQIEWLEKAG